jgi:hypothetical protein
MIAHWVKSYQQTRGNLSVELSMKFIAQRCKVILVEWFIGTKVNHDEQPWLLVHQVFSRYMCQGGAMFTLYPCKTNLATEITG